MFAQTHSPTRRPLVWAGLVGLAALGVLAAPAGAQSSVSERALLNVVRESFPGPESSPVAEPLLAAVDGDRALLGRSATGGAHAQRVATGRQEEAAFVDGERALLGTVTQSARRRLTLAW